ncbi:MAG: DUF1614 domain-containing protein [Methanobacteriota archaeon]
MANPVPGPLFLLLAAVGLVYVVFRRRRAELRESGFSEREVGALLLGSLAGWFVNVPLVPLGVPPTESPWIAVNLGGAIVPALLVARMLRRGTLPLASTAGGVLLVAFVSYLIVTFDPEVGVVAVFPEYLLPVAVAVAYALLVALGDPRRSGVVAYAAGSVGTLVGADLFNLGAIVRHFSREEGFTLVSIGGAGVFDMVYLAGILALSTNLVLVLLIHPRRAFVRTGLHYPARPLGIEDPTAWTAIPRGAHAPASSRARIHLSRAEEHLSRAEHAKAAVQSFQAVDTLLRVGRPSLLARLQRGEVRNAALTGDLAFLAEVYQRALEGPVGRVEAGLAHETARRIAGGLARYLGPAADEPGAGT